MNDAAEPGEPGAIGLPSTILAEHRKEILTQWEGEARQLKPARLLDHRDLLDHLPAVLDRIGQMADQLAAGEAPDAPQPEADAHGAVRVQDGFDMAHLVLEYGILRRTVARFTRGDPRASVALDGAIDRALVKSAERFAAERDRALRDARRTVCRLEGIVSAIFDGVIVTEESGQVVLTNEGAERIFGVPREDLRIPLMDYPRAFNLRTPEGEPATPIAGRALAGEVVPPVERVISRPLAGGDCHIRASAAPLRGVDGTVEGAVMIVSDITDRKEAEIELQESARLREDILAVVSHDLRNPLGAIRMSVELLVRRGSDPRDRKQLETIQRCAARMERLIADLLDVASIRVGHLAVEPLDLDIGPLVDEAVEAHVPLAHSKGLILRREILAPHALATLDRGRTFQVLANLLGNAIKFCSEGDSIVVRTSLEPGAVHLAVSDTGPGIPAADLRRIFEPYWSARNPSKQGTGLGLFISKGIVDAQGGRLWVESEVGSGTTFHFTVPLATCQRSHAPPRASVTGENMPPSSNQNTN